MECCWGVGDYDVVYCDWVGVVSAYFYYGEFVDVGADFPFVFVLVYLLDGYCCIVGYGAGGAW